MEAKQTLTFEAQLELARQKPPGKLRAADVRRLLKTAGKRPTETQVALVCELLAGSSANSPAVFDILCELELSSRPDPWMVLLKPALWNNAMSALTQLPPEHQDLNKARAWLEGQLVPGPDATQVATGRVRAVLVWLVSKHRSPEFFLQCFLEV